MGIVWNWEARRSKLRLTKDQIEDQCMGMEQYIDQRLIEIMGVPEKYMGNKPTIKKIIRTPDSVTILIDHEKAPE